MLTVSAVVAGQVAATLPGARHRGSDVVTAAEPVVNPADRRAGCPAAPVHEDAYLLPELKTLLVTAAAVIDRHTDAAGRCRACARPWPCGPAQLADLVLGGF